MDVVTGAFGYTGKYITRRLLALGRRVKTLTGRPDRPNPFGDEVSVAPFNFDNPSALADSIRGADTLYNTYWLRFPRGRATFDGAIRNTLTLFRAAEDAGVKRVVHVSITNPAEDSLLPYFRGKAILERTLLESSLSYAILRPAVIFGGGGILINNVAWFIRRFPVFLVPGSGNYELQPVFVGDLAHIAVEVAQRTDNVVLDVAGPEIYTFDRLVRVIAAKIGRRARLVHVPPGVTLALSKFVGLLVGDVILTRDEVAGLTANLLVSKRAPQGTMLLSDWLERHRDTVGLRYASELRRHYR